MTVQPARILCVDDHAFLVEGLEKRLDAEPDLEFIGRLPTADTLVAEVKRRRADVVLLDIEMPGLDPFEALEDVVRVCPDVRVIMLSAFVRDHYIDTASRLGAWGYLSKSDEPSVVVAGIRDVLAGRVAMSAAIRERTETPGPAGRADAGGARSRLDSLTQRETQILRLIALGRTRTDIADELCLSPSTVDNHRKAIMRKLAINDRVALARFAIAEGLVEV